MNYSIRRAAKADLPSVMKLLNQRTDWLSSKGYSQWQNRDFHVTMETFIRQGFTWLAFDGSTPVATVSLSTLADKDFWRKPEMEQPAVYMSKMATSPKYAGRRLGEKLTHWAYRYAQGSSISRLRWDAWRDNEKLIRYYQQLGATFIRTESPAHRQSGALFEVAFRASSVSSFNDPGDKSLQLIPNQSIQTYYPSEDASNHGASNVYMSMHQIDDLKLPPLHAKRSLHIEPMTTGCSGTHPENMATIYNTGGQWRAHWFFSHAIESWPLLANLVEGIPYQIRHVQASTLTSKCALYLHGWMP